MCACLSMLVLSIEGIKTIIYNFQITFSIYNLYRFVDLKLDDGDDDDDDEDGAR